MESFIKADESSLGQILDGVMESTDSGMHEDLLTQALIKDEPPDIKEEIDIPETSDLLQNEEEIVTAFESDMKLMLQNIGGEDGKQTVDTSNESDQRLQTRIDGTSKAPENVGKRRTTQKKWTQTYALNEAGESNLTEIMIDVKLERESRTGVEHSDTILQINSTHKRNIEMEHLKVYNTSQNYQKNNCDQCGIHLKSLTLLNKHLKIDHSKALICNHCSEVFNDKNSLILHIGMHTVDDNMWYHCTGSSEILSGKKSLNEQIIQKRTAETPYVCEYCNKRFCYKSLLINHLRKHTGEKPHHCTYCKKAFADKYYLNLHVLVHTGEKPYRCSYCNKAFTRKRNLKTHILLHTGEKPHHCSHCDNSFAEKSDLNRHILIHTGEKPHRCSYCNKAFSQKSNLNRHILMHTGVKPHQCSYCNKAFTQKSKLKRHILVHMGKKPHHCSYCNNAFAEKSNLNRHLLKHTGEKPHRCSYCNKAFTRKNNLNIHILLHTREKLAIHCTNCNSAFAEKS